MLYLEGHEWLNGTTTISNAVIPFHGNGPVLGNVYGNEANNGREPQIFCMCVCIYMEVVTCKRPGIRLFCYRTKHSSLMWEDGGRILNNWHRNVSEAVTRLRKNEKNSKEKYEMMNGWYIIYLVLTFVLSFYLVW